MNVMVQKNVSHRILFCEILEAETYTLEQYHIAFF